MGYFSTGSDPPIQSSVSDHSNGVTGSLNNIHISVTTIYFIEVEMKRLGSEGRKYLV